MPKWLPACYLTLFSYLTFRIYMCITSFFNLMHLNSIHWINQNNHTVESNFRIIIFIPATITHHHKIFIGVTICTKVSATWCNSSLLSKPWNATDSDQKQSFKRSKSVFTLLFFCHISCWYSIHPQKQCLLVLVITWIIIHYTQMHVCRPQWSWMIESWLSSSLLLSSNNLCARVKDTHICD